jgi:DNA-binding MurR/RpiR family transcriptional regulator
METTAIAELIRSELDGMPARMRTAARFVMDHPSEVALLSMREQARIAGVPPATMTRLAQRIGFTGYQQLKDAYAEAVRGSVPWFSGRAADLIDRSQEIGEAALAEETARTIASSIEELARPATVDALILAADVLSRCDRIFAIGSRATYPVAFLFAYTQSYFWDRAVLLEGPGGTGTDPLRRATARDGLLAVSLSPYAASTHQAVEIALAAGVAVVAITDSDSAPIARSAKAVIRVSPRSPSFFDTISPALAAAEMLVALIASRVGATVPDEIRRRERQFRESGVFWSQARRTTP